MSKDSRTSSNHSSPLIRTDVITTVAGSGLSDEDGGQATSTSLSSPQGLALDVSGNIYIADSARIRMVRNGSGIITTVAGTGIYGYSGDGGQATDAKLSYLYGVAVDASGNIYIADTHNSCIRMVMKSTGVITTVAGTGSVGVYGGDGGPATSAALGYLTSVAVDALGNIYIADSSNRRVFMLTTSTGVITTVATVRTVATGSVSVHSDDDASASPLRVAVDASGDIYLTDAQNSTIRIVTKSTGAIRTMPIERGSNDGSSPIIPHGVAVDASGNIYIADAGNSCIRMVTKSTGVITTVAGTGGIGGYSGDGGKATLAKLSNPSRVAVDASGDIYIADVENSCIRMISQNVGLSESRDNRGQMISAPPSRSPSTSPPSSRSLTPSLTSSTSPSPSPSPSLIPSASPSPTALVESVIEATQVQFCVSLCYRNKIVREFVVTT